MIESKVKELINTNEIYSTEEQLIGKWIDGKNLYKRTFVYNNATSGSQIISVGQLSDFDSAFIDYSASFYINTNTNMAASPAVISINSSGRNVESSTYTSYSAINKNNGNINVYYGSTTASSKTVVTVKYTKSSE